MFLQRSLSKIIRIRWFLRQNNMINIPKDDAKLLDECEIKTSRSSGKGGQHVNKVETAVQLKHIPTGLQVRSEKNRSQYLNKKLALRLLRKKLNEINFIKAPRLASKPSIKSIAERLKDKKMRSEKKFLRKKPDY